jgi:hypothetical protein
MLGRLEDARIEELAGLVGKAGTDRGGWDREALGRRETKLLEALVEQAAGLDRGHYEAERKAETDRFAALAAEARRMPRLSREAETDFFQTMFRMLNVGHLWPNHVSLLLLVIAMLRAGEGLAESGCRVEGSGADARLVVNFARGLGLRGDGLPNWRWHLEWLAKNNWLTLEEGRVTWHIGLGPRTLKMLRERS